MNAHKPSQRRKRNPTKAQREAAIRDAEAKAKIILKDRPNSIHKLQAAMAERQAKFRDDLAAQQRKAAAEARPVPAAIRWARLASGPIEPEDPAASQ
jgi:hypothetical protein